MHATYGDRPCSVYLVIPLRASLVPVVFSQVILRLTKKIVGFPIRAQYLYFLGLLQRFEDFYFVVERVDVNHFGWKRSVLAMVAVLARKKDGVKNEI